MQTDEENTGSTNPFIPPPFTQAQKERVGFGPRLLAWIIDALIGGVFTLILTFILMQVGMSPSETIQQSIDEVMSIYQVLGIADQISDFVTQLLPALVMAGAIGSISYSLIEGLTGASPGKRVMRIKIATQEGKTGSTGLFLRRWAVKNSGSIFNFLALVPSLGIMDTVSSFASFVIFIGCFFVLSERRLALHDMIAQTAVYNVDEIS